jgi:nucleotide-binding universal stress UspA family protein
MGAINKILVPTDFSAHADEAFRVACTLARATGAEVVVFHVARPPAVVTEGGALLAEPGKELTNLWDRFRELLSGEPRVRVEHRLIVADRPNPAHILEILDELGCDLIVMGTHGRRGLRQVLFGSVTEEVVRRARCPVMVVKAPAPAAPVPEPAQAAGEMAVPQA